MGRSRDQPTNDEVQQVAAHIVGMTLLQAEKYARRKGVVLEDRTATGRYGWYTQPLDPRRIVVVLTEEGRIERATPDSRV